MVSRTELALVAIALFGAGCDQIFDIKDRTFNDAGADAARGHDATAPLEAGKDTGSIDTGPPPDTGVDTGTASAFTFYVAGTGGGTACTRGAPCKTIARGILTAIAAAAAAAGTNTPTVMVCSGDYDESGLKVTGTVRLLGGYACGTWIKTGSPPPSIVLNGNATLNALPAITFSGGAVRPATTLDGFTVYTPSQDQNGGIFTGIECNQGAAPNISNNVIAPQPVTAEAGAPTTCLNEADGVTVWTGSGPQLVGNTITACGINAKGVVTDTSTVALTLAGNTITGGGTGGSVDSYGVFLQPANSDAAGPSSFSVVGNTIHGGPGTHSFGVYVNNTGTPGRMSLTLGSNAIDATPNAIVSSDDCYGNAVFINASGNATITGNRISGGTCSTATPSPSTIGLNIQNLGEPMISNNMILGGVVTNGTATSQSIALQLINVPAPQVRFNTLVGGAVSPLGHSTGVVLSGVAGAVFADNIIVGETAAGLAGFGFLVTPSGCDGGAAGVAQFENNAMLNVPNALLATVCGGHTTDFNTITKLVDRLDASVGDANVLFASRCPDGGGPCALDPACVSASACFTELFSQWDVSSNGAANLFSNFPADAGCASNAGVGWTLGGTSPCAIARGAPVNLSNLVTTDLYGPNCRPTVATAKLSLGADQFTASCLQDIP